MLHPSTQKLIDRLAVMTAQKKIDWIEKDNGDVLYATEGYAVRLSPEPPQMVLATDAGKVLEDATPTLLTGTVYKDGATYGDLVATIVRDACRDARGTDAAINTLLEGLSDDTAPAEEEDTSGDETDEAAESDALAAAAIPEEVAPAEPEIAPEAVEDPVDETMALSAAGPEETEAAAAESPAPEPEITEADDTAADVSVPEAAFGTALKSGGEMEVEDTPAEAVTASEEASGEPSGDESGEYTSTDDDESYVSGAVARLADGVNGQPALSGTDAVEEMPPAEEDPATAQDNSDEAGTEPVAAFPPSYSIALDDVPQTAEAHDATAPEAAAPVEETGTEETPPVSEGDGFADTVAAPTTGAAAETAGGEAQTHAPVETVVPDDGDTQSYVPFGAGGLETAGADASASEESPEADDDIPFDSGLGAAAATMAMPDVKEDTSDTATDGEPAAADTDPFGTPQAAPAMDAGTEPPENTPEDMTAAEPATEPAAWTNEAEETPAADDAQAAEEAPGTFSAETQPEETPAEPVSTSLPETEPQNTAGEPPASTSSFNGFGAGLGFGATPGGFQPSAPKPAGDPQPARDTGGQTPVYIDATEDYPDLTDAQAGTSIPDVANLDAGDLEETGEAYVEASVSEADLDAVSPQQQDTTPEASSSPEQALSLVETSNDNTEPEASEDPQEDQRPARPKTRFNPWT